MRIKPTMSMHLSISDLNADLVNWQQERIKELEKAVRVLLGEPHETVINRIHSEIFPDEVAAEEKAVRNYNYSSRLYCRLI
jgi:hypothetical protein